MGRRNVRVRGSARRMVAARNTLKNDAVHVQANTGVNAFGASNIAEIEQASNGQAKGRVGVRPIRLLIR